MTDIVTEFNGIKAGDIIHNDNGTDYVVLAINAKLDRTLLMEHKLRTPNYVGAWRLQKMSNGNWYWTQGHYFMDNLTSAVNYVTDKE